MEHKPYTTRDYKYRQEQATKAKAVRGRPLWHLAWVVTLFAGISIANYVDLTGTIKPLFAPSVEPLATEADSALTPDQEQPTDAEETPAAEPGQWHEIIVRQGQSLAAIFLQLKLAPKVLYDIMHADGAAKTLRTIKPGEVLRFHIVESELAALHYLPNPTSRLEINADGTGYSFAEYNREYEKRTQIASGVITSSLFQSAQEAGISEAITMELAYIFGWDVDFALDIREGDKFTVVYEELYLDGAKVKDGDILATEFVNNGQVLRALRYTDPDGNTDYFSPDGKNMRKTFLRTPVDFTRISSYFGQRKHPVLNRMRVHKGVDYAAPRGTMVKTTGNGKVLFRGRKGGYGNTIVIQHGSGYRTLYAHLNGFQRGLRVGNQVKQGQTIGYVGSTGLATGPHLHYEFLVNNVHRNPLRVKLPDAHPIDSNYMPDFRTKTTGLRALLDIITNTNVALRDPTAQ